MIDTELEKFLKYLMESNRAPAAKSYRTALTSFVSWLRERDKTLSTFTTADADVFFRNIENPHTANMFLAALKSFMANKYRSMPPDDPRFAIEMQRYMQMESIKARPNRLKHEKVALTPSEIGDLLELIEKRKNPVLYAGTVICFLWGARSMEQEYFMRAEGIQHPAVYRWNKNEMMLWTTKVHHPRFLCWNEKFTPYIKTWVKALPSFTVPGEWLTSRLHNYEIKNLRITSRVGRKSVQTNFRMDGIEDWIIDATLGHASKNMADTYSDFTIYESKIKDALVNKHYLITHDII